MVDAGAAAPLSLIMKSTKSNTKYRKMNFGAIEEAICKHYRTYIKITNYPNH
jgi:hypothetical protein